MSVRPPTLQQVLSFNALTSAAFGAAALVAAPWWSRVLDVDHTAAVAVTGAGLLVFAADVAWVARRPDRAQRWVSAVTAVDLAWVAASLVVLFGGWLNGWGALVHDRSARSWMPALAMSRT